ncbi:peptidoglycan DD-metalloendopeptidase family protein [Halanaerobium congolense]|uniref:peptidoglycan DD-metalloendopeptidase family protein n=1 Tax=Halanaerobium congolense TaxID=54121 RepID=UPI000884C59B|nr:peptidoglycan DD-metalloendopeptidase family protein [Halanaerobium congolense]SDH42658.1 Murein DD-endopeptidase MepM and murein hydrolase activator NlpD, contain LysM domain [Halanaerobium congolense]SHM87360.1 Murein DD-endopeptidase MepM and murein hydrolase activator NlpD, contain LysM domain [Halanaerobium congolense]
MRRRERLTGFFIIFILLTFSAYSNSMNVGGRMLQSNLQSDSEKQQNINNFQERNTATNRDFNKINNSTKQKEKTTMETKNKTENNNSDTADIQDNSDRKTEKNLNLNSDNNRDLKINSPREENNGEKESPEKTFTEVEKKPLIKRVKVHTVRSGETLWDIAHQHGLNIDSLIGANNISNMNSIKPGQKFKILPIKGIIYRVSPGESVASIASKFNIKTETIMKDNNLDNPSNLKIDQELILRGAKPEFSYKDRLDQKFMYPINTRITSYYGPRWGRVHEGIDFAAPMGSPIRAVSSGRVVYSGWASGYGYVVIIEHQKGLRTLYAHNSKLLVRNGESVGRGEVISRSGNTGNSTGPHLHFEVQVNGRPENPLNYIHR